MVWRAITYRLFAGTVQRPAIGLRIRAGLFCSGLLVLAGLSYKSAPHFAAQHDVPLLVAQVCTFSFFGVLAIGSIADSHQRAFLEKLRLLAAMPLPVSYIRRAYLYAALPVNLVAMALVAPALFAAFGASIRPLPLALLIAAYSCTAALYDSLLRIARMPMLAAYAIRFVTLALFAALARILFTAGPHATGWCYASVACGGLCAVVIALFVHRPLRTEFTKLAVPIIEGKPTLISQLALRALRLARYVGANIMLWSMAGGLALLSFSEHPLFSPDGALLMVLLLAGTLGQEARAVSARLYPVELVLYGLPYRWLLATWLLAVVNGLVCVDICLAGLVVWAPNALSISSMQAGYVGLACIAAGIASGSIIVPQKHDILAQCASTALYGGFAWAIIKLFGVTGLHSWHYMALGIGLLALSIGISYVSEKIRWTITIRSRHGTV